MVVCVEFLELKLSGFGQLAGMQPGPESLPASAAQISPGQVQQVRPR
jgi:hypothetical protein